MAMETIIVTGFGILILSLLVGLLLVASRRSVPITPWNTLRVGEEYVVIATENLLARNFARVRDVQGQVLFITLPEFYREIVAGDKLMLCRRKDKTLRLKICDDKASLI